MKIYDDSGYVNIRGILEQGYPFNFLIGGRGTGKTYTTLKVAKEDCKKFMLMRRTQSQADLISKPEFSVFKPLNEDLGWNVMVHRISKYNSAFYIPCFSTAAATVDIPTPSAGRGSLFSTSSLTPVISGLFDDSHFKICVSPEGGLPGEHVCVPGEGHWWRGGMMPWGPCSSAIHPRFAFF